MRSYEVAHHGCRTRRIEGFTDQHVLVVAFMEGVSLLLGTIDLGALDSLDHGVECRVTSIAETHASRRDKNREGVAAVVIDELHDRVGACTTGMLRPQVIPGKGRSVRIRPQPACPEGIVALARGKTRSRPG